MGRPQHSHTSPSSRPHSAGNSGHVVAAATTAVGRDPTSTTLTS
jgi:hypothetical protein